MTEPSNDCSPPQWLNEFRMTDAAANSTIQVRMGCAVVRSGTVLPPYCIVSNEPVSQEEMETRKLLWIPDDIGVLFFLAHFIGFFPGLIGYYIARKECALTFGLARVVRRDRRRRLVMKMVVGGVVLLACVLVIILSLVEVTKENGVLLFIAYILFLATMIIMLLGDDILTVKKHVNNEFWIERFSKDFLSRIDKPFEMLPPK